MYLQIVSFELSTKFVVVSSIAKISIPPVVDIIFLLFIIYTIILLKQKTYCNYLFMEIIVAKFNKTLKTFIIFNFFLSCQNFFCVTLNNAPFTITKLCNFDFWEKRTHPDWINWHRWSIFSYLCKVRVFDKDMLHLLFILGQHSKF